MSVMASQIWTLKEREDGDQLKIFKCEWYRILKVLDKKRK